MIKDKKMIRLTLMALFTVSVRVAYPANDSIRVLTFDDFMERVISHHPVSKQAALQVTKGEATLRSSRGAFDPKISTDFNQKYFDGSQYYSLGNAGLKIPTWLGIEFQAGYEQNQGIYLNPEHNTPDAGLVYAGLSLPIGQGLFIDKRRAELEKAKKFQEITKLEQQIMLNQLLYESGKIYWDWFMAYSQMKVYEEALQLAEERYLAIKKGAALGDVPPIDTLEAGIQLQNRKLSLQQAQLQFLNTSEMLSLYLWIDGIVPVETTENTIPISIDSLSGFMVNYDLIHQKDTFIMNHPELRQYRIKIDQIEIDKRWKKEQLKPVVNLKYNALSEPVNGNPLASYNINDYTWGFEFSMPLLLRKERGEYRLADIKIQETELDATTKKADIELKANIALNEWETTREQIELYTQTVKDYFGLLSGERKMFDAGESSLFMVNSRELGYIQAQLKLIELVTKNQKAELATNYALGILVP